jgi:hypothetical protein
MTPALEDGLQLCSACSGDYEDPDSLSDEDESPAPEHEEENGD